MKLVWTFFLLAFLLSARSQQESTEANDVNVNSRYLIESVDVDHPTHYRLSSSVTEEMQKLIGQRLNTEALNRLAGRIRNELRAHDVTFKITRGALPDRVKVLLEVERRSGMLEVSVPKFIYNSSLGLTGAGEAGLNLGPNQFTLGLLSDIDSHIGREAGVTAKYRRLRTGRNRVSFEFEFDSFHEQYEPATLTALADPKESSTVSSLGVGLYRSRTNFEPSATFVLSEPLTLTVGLSFQQLEPQLPAAQPDLSNAVVNTLRYHRRWVGSGSIQQDLDAGYSLRAATRILGGNLPYTRQQFSGRYTARQDEQSLQIDFGAGVISGRAPLFDRFVLGNSLTLRGWNMNELDPLGGNHMVYGSVTYGYRVMRLFYDTGSIWDQSRNAEAKQSAGIGFCTSLGVLRKDGFLIALAFPIRGSRMEPVLIAGMNF